MNMQMTREEVIRLSRKFVHQFDGRDVEDAFVEDVLEAAADMLEQNAPGWISVKDRLPENEVPVLIATKWKFADRQGVARALAFHTNGKTFTGNSRFTWNNDGYDNLIYDKAHDEWIIPEGWWEYARYNEQFCPVDELILGWMPMPEPPKEVMTNGA